MLNHNFSYADCLDNATKSAWTVDDCFQGRDFDFTKRFLPDRIAGVDIIQCLNEAEKLRLNQIRGNSYCHIFAFVEEPQPLSVDHNAKWIGKPIRLIGKFPVCKVAPVCINWGGMTATPLAPGQSTDCQCHT